MKFSLATHFFQLVCSLFDKFQFYVNWLKFLINFVQWTGKCGTTFEWSAAVGWRQKSWNLIIVSTGSRKVFYCKWFNGKSGFVIIEISRNCALFKSTFNVYASINRAAQQKKWIFYELRMEKGKKKVDRISEAWTRCECSTRFSLSFIRLTRTSGLRTFIHGGFNAENWTFVKWTPIYDVYDVNGRNYFFMISPLLQILDSYSIHIVKAQ